MMREREVEPIVVFMEKDENVLAFCPTCESSVFKGTDLTALTRQILKRRVIDHLDFFDGRHNVDVIYPRKESGRRIFEGTVFVKSQPYILDLQESGFLKLS